MLDSAHPLFFDRKNVLCMSVAKCVSRETLIRNAEQNRAVIEADKALAESIQNGLDDVRASLKSQGFSDEQIKQFGYHPDALDYFIDYGIPAMIICVIVWVFTL